MINKELLTENNRFKIIGEVKKIKEVHKAPNSDFIKRELILETIGERPKNIRFEFRGAKRWQLQEVAEDSIVVVFFNMYSTTNKAGTRVFNNNSAFKVIPIEEYLRAPEEHDKKHLKRFSY